MSQNRALQYAVNLLIGFLLLLWAVSIAAEVTYSLDLPKYRSLEIAPTQGSMSLIVTPYRVRSGLVATWSSRPLSHQGLLGHFAWGRNLPWYAFQVACPFSVLLTALLPLAIGIRTRFRYPLSLWLIYTALIAAQCAYYLR